MMIKLGLASVFAFCFVSALSSTGCQSVDRAYDCTSICTKYRDCVDADYDVTACANECRENAADSEAFEDKADDCQKCVDDRSCLGATFACATECIGIVP